MGGNDVVPSAFLVEPEERPRPLRVVVGDPQRNRGAHPREAVDEDAEERAVAKTHQGCDVDAVEEAPGLLGGEDRGLAGLDDVPRPPDRARGVEGEDLADDEPVEEHPKGGYRQHSCRNALQGLGFSPRGSGRGRGSPNRQSGSGRGAVRSRSAFGRSAVDVGYVDPTDFDASQNRRRNAGGGFRALNVILGTNLPMTPKRGAHLDASDSNPGTRRDPQGEVSKLVSRALPRPQRRPHGACSCRLTPRNFALPEQIFELRGQQQH